MDLELDKQRLTLKAAYYGPPLSGKTTNILALRDRVAPERRGELVTLDTYQDRTVFFDLLPLGIRVPSGLEIKVKVCAVPGHVRHDATRKALLFRADGVVFVADSRTSEQRSNGVSFRNLQENSGSVGIDLAKMPLVVQFNKRDLEDIVPESELARHWQAASAHVRFSSALHGINVVEVFLELMGMMYDACDLRMKLADKHGLDRATFLKELGFDND